MLAVVLLAVGESSKEMVSNPAPGAWKRVAPTVVGEEPRSEAEQAYEEEVFDSGRAATTLPSTQQAFSTAVSESLWVFRVLSTVCGDSARNNARNVV